MQKDKKQEDIIFVYKKLIEEKSILLEETSKEILELKNNLYEQKKQFSEICRKYEEEIENLKKDNVYYKNLQPINFEKENVSQEDLNHLQCELQAIMIQLEGIRASSEIGDEKEGLETIKQELAKKTEEIFVLQDVIKNQKQEISELRSLLVDDVYKLEEKEMNKTLDHLKKRLQETVNETSLFYNEVVE